MLLLLFACPSPKPDDSQDSAVEADADTDADTDTDTDSDADADSDADTDSDTDTDTGPFHETDCFDEVDNDADGLLDCEDDDCVDVCIEDCDNEIDDDGDGDIDCDDDKCVGDEACDYRAFDVTLRYDLERVVAVWGPLVPYYYDEYTIGLGYGTFKIQGTSPDPDTADTADESYSFSCRGTLRVISDGIGYDSGYYSGYAGLSEDTGYCAGCDAMLNLDPALGMTNFIGDCPVSVLPTSQWAFFQGERSFWNDVSGSWQEQYRSKLSGVIWDGDPGYYYYGEFQYPQMLTAQTWTGDYLPSDL